MTVSDGLQRALNLLREGSPEAAQEILDSVMKVAPRNFNALHLAGIAQSELGNLENAANFFGAAIEVRGDIPAVHFRLGNVLKNLGRHNEAVASLRRVLELKPDHAEAQKILGDELRQLQQNEEAIASYRRALAIRPDFAAAHNNLGLTLLDLLQYNEAVCSFRRALDIRSDYSNALNNLGVALLKLQKYEKAIDYFRRALKYNPEYPAALNNLGNVLLDLKKPQEAMRALRRALELKPDFPEALNNLGIAQLEFKQHSAAIQSFRRAVELKPSFEFACSQLASQELTVCEWARYDETAAMVRSRVETGESAVFPFLFLAFWDDPAEQLKCASRYGLEKTGSIRPFEQIPQRPPDGRIRIAYLSADFHEHATAYLMAELFERHDRKKFELHAISFGPEVEDGMRARLKRAFAHWHSVSTESDREVAQLIRSLDIEIAVDLKGYTRDSRPGILAHRPAPIQVNYLGYPGSMGVPFIDYILVDSFVAPADQQVFFAEKLVQLPNSYQVNDTKRPIAYETPSRSACGLPEKGFVFCCFNNNWKIAPSIFDVWMKLLTSVDGSVLWLLEDNKWARENLCREAVRRGVDPERLIFAPRLPLAEHLARHRLADLFLDTLPCNAHTTASDALWAGLPVLTCAGRSFHARVAGSVLQAAGLPELITTDVRDYEALAIKLACEPTLLAAYRQRLAHSRANAPLFDSARFARNLEAAFEHMSQRWREGKTPASFSVPDCLTWRPPERPLSSAS